MGWVKGLEPSTYGTTTRRSSQLSYTHRVPLRKALDYYGSQFEFTQGEIPAIFKSLRKSFRCLK